MPLVTPSKIEHETIVTEGIVQGPTPTSGSVSLDDWIDAVLI